jgi:hypothetical protein
MRKSTKGPAAMGWILATLKWQGESLVDTFHVSYIVKGRLLNHGGTINYWNTVGRENRR